MKNIVSLMFIVILFSFNLKPSLQACPGRCWNGKDTTVSPRTPSPNGPITPRGAESSFRAEASPPTKFERATGTKVDLFDIMDADKDQWIDRDDYIRISKAEVMNQYKGEITEIHRIIGSGIRRQDFNNYFRLKPVDLETINGGKNYTSKNLKDCFAIKNERSKTFFGKKRFRTPQEVADFLRTRYGGIPTNDPRYHFTNQY